MNDSELDQLLNTWEAPAPSEALRQRVRNRFPRSARPVFRFRLRWVVAVAAVSATLAIATAQSGGGGGAWDGFEAHLMRLHQMFFYWLHPEAQALQIRKNIEESQPKAFVDGKPLQGSQVGKWHAATMFVEVPGDGVYVFTTYAGGAKTFKEAGKVHGNVVTFQAGAHTVRIECNTPVTDDDQVVYAFRRE